MSAKVTVRVPESVANRLSDIENLSALVREKVRDIMDGKTVVVTVKPHNGKAVTISMPVEFYMKVKKFAEENGYDIADIIRTAILVIAGGNT